MFAAQSTPPLLFSLLRLCLSVGGRQCVLGPGPSLSESLGGRGAAILRGAGGLRGRGGALLAAPPSFKVPCPPLLPCCGPSPSGWDRGWGRGVGWTRVRGHHRATPLSPFSGVDAWGWGAGSAHLWPLSHASTHMSFPSVLAGGEREEGTRASVGPLHSPLPPLPPTSGGTGRPASQGPLGLRVQRPVGRPAGQTPFDLLRLDFPISLPSEVELVSAGRAARSTRCLTFAFSFSHASSLLIAVCV